jgi:antitoxin VapB
VERQAHSAYIPAQGRKLFEKEETMALNIKDPATDRLARKLAARTGESITLAVRTAIEHRLNAETMKREREREQLFRRIRQIQKEVAALPDLTPASPHDLVEYDENGLPV